MYIEESKSLGQFCPQNMDGPDRRRCVGAECMAWRWRVTYTVLTEYPYTANATISDTVGYCGMAGKPEA